jgi:hypothetical protein
VQDSIRGPVLVVAEFFDGTSRWKNQQLDPAPFSFAPHFWTHRQLSIDSGTNNQTSAVPRDVFVQ